MNNASNPTRQTNTQRDPNRPPLVNERERESVVFLRDDNDDDERLGP